MIKLKGINKKFLSSDGQVNALCDVDIEIAKGARDKIFGVFRKPQGFSFA